MSVKLRRKKTAGEKISLYLDIYHNGKRQYDFLKLYLLKGTDRVRKKVLHSDFNCNTISGKNCPEAFLSCFKLCELGVIMVLVNTIPDT